MNRLQKLAGIKEIKINNPNHEGKLRDLLHNYGFTWEQWEKIKKLDDITPELEKDLDFVEDRLYDHKSWENDLDEIKINNPIISPGEIHELYKEIWWKIDREWEDGGGGMG